MNAKVREPFYDPFGQTVVASAKRILRELNSVRCEVCRKLGFCGPPGISLRWMVDNLPLSSGDFADEVLRAEGFSIRSEFRRPIMGYFERRFGSLLVVPEDHMAELRQLANEQ